MIDFDLLKVFCSEITKGLKSSISNSDLVLKIIKNTEYLAAFVVFIAITKYSLNVIKELVNFTLKLAFVLLILKIGLDLYNNKLNYSIKEFRNGFSHIFLIFKIFFFFNHK